jgi:hypothetical protein
MVAGPAHRMRRPKPDHLSDPEWFQPEMETGFVLVAIRYCVFHGIKKLREQFAQQRLSPAGRWIRGFHDVSSYRIRNAKPYCRVWKPLPSALLPVWSIAKLLISEHLANCDSATDVLQFSLNLESDRSIACEICTINPQNSHIAFSPDSFQQRTNTSLHLRQRTGEGCRAEAHSA